jgi:arginyl-tRNA synthetase
MKTAYIGKISELKAQIWLLNQGFEVFANVKPSGPADIIAWDKKKDKFLKIDVKTVRIYKKKDGSKTYTFSGLGNHDSKLSQTKITDGIAYLGYCEEEDRFLWF